MAAARIRSRKAGSSGGDVSTILPATHCDPSASPGLPVGLSSGLFECGLSLSKISTLFGEFLLFSLLSEMKPACVCHHLPGEIEQNDLYEHDSFNKRAKKQKDAYRLLTVRSPLPTISNSLSSVY